MNLPVRTLATLGVHTCETGATDALSFSPAIRVEEVRYIRAHGPRCGPVRMVGISGNFCLVKARGRTYQSGYSTPVGPCIATREV